jgi:hypothetical protein
MPSLSRARRNRTDKRAAPKVKLDQWRSHSPRGNTALASRKNSLGFNAE